MFRLSTFLAVFAILVIQGCSTIPRETLPDGLLDERYAARASELTAVESWSLRARIAVSDARDGGSGSLRWSTEGPDSHMSFHGALGRGAWRLSSNPGGARLELADGSVYEARTVTELARLQLGWSVPVESLGWWVRGLQAPGDAERRLLDVDGVPTSIVQHGWTIEFGGRRDVNGVPMPDRVTARQGERRVKLVIREWSLDG